VDGLRITDQAALDAVVSVLAGRTNTTLVAAIGAAGGRAIGLTGADGRIGLSTRTGTFTTVSGQTVDLGLVGQPDGTDASLLADLLRINCIPVIASVGVTREGTLLNVNADTIAAHLAGLLRADRLVIAGATAGVLDNAGVVIPALSLQGIDHDRVGRRALRHGGQADGMPGRTDRRRPRSSDRLRARRPGLRNGLGNDDSSGDGDDMTTATDVIALETDHLLQVYRRGRVVFERGRGCRCSMPTDARIWT
jgi:hypothetical protein